jgi:hypothetical protein
LISDSAPHFRTGSCPAVLRDQHGVFISSDEQLLSLRHKANETLGIFHSQLYNPEIKKDLAFVTALQDRLNEYLDMQRIVRNVLESADTFA